MALSPGESGGGYPRSMLRVTDSFDRSGLDTQPSRGGGWFSSLLDASRQISEARRKREEEEKRRLAAQLAEDEANARNEQQQLRDEQRRVTEERLADPVWSWVHSPQGSDFLSSGGAEKVDYNAFARDPDRFLAENDNMREFRWGFNGELADKGVPPDVTERMARYASTEDGAKHFEGIGQDKSYGLGPLEALKEKQPIVGGLVEYGVGAIPVVGAAMHGLNRGSDDASGSELWADALGAVGNRLVMSSPVNAAEKGAADLLAGKVGSTAAQVAAKAGTRAALNVAEDVPLSAAEMTLRGADPGSEDFWKVLTAQAGMSAAAGAAIPVAGPAFRGALANVPPELKGAAAAYLAAKSLGADEDEARTYALAAGAATSFARRGVGESFKTGFGATDVLNKAQRAPAQEAVTDLPVGPDIMYHGTAGEFSGQLRPDAFLTPSLADAEAFARGSSRLTGEPATVIAFQAKDGATIPSRSDDFAASQGARQVVDPDGLVEVGRSGVEMRPAMGAGIEPGDIPPKGDGPPARVQRFEEPDTPPSGTDKPHGLYTTPADVQSPHADLGGEKSTYDTNPDARILTVDTTDSPVLRRGAVGSSAGVVALREIVGPGTFSRLQRASQEDLLAELREVYPDVDWTRYVDRQEILEGLGGIVARGQGYDAIWALDRKSPEFSEYVALTDNAFVTPRSIASVGEQLPVRPGAQALVPAGAGGSQPPTVPPAPPDNWQPPDIPHPPGKRNIVQPRPADGIPIAKPGMGEDFLRKADEQLDSHRATDAYKAVVARVRGEGADGTTRGSARDKLASLLNVPTHLIEAIDPASKYARPVLRSVLAASNFLNSQAIELVGRQRQIVSDLKPLIGEEFSRRLEREAVRLSPAAVGVAASVPFGGPETKEGRQIIAAGAVASYGLHMGDAGIKRKLPFDSIKYTSKLDGGNLPGAKVDARDLPAGLKTGQGKLVHMILHPEDFDLTPDQLKAAKASQGTLQAAFAGMQEFQDWAGKQVTKDTIGQENRLFQWFTKESVEKVLGKDYFAARSGKPGFAADLPVEQQRRLGDNIVDAMIKHPELKIDGDVVGLMMRDLDQKTRVSSNAIIVKGLTSGTEGVDGFVKDRTSALGDKLREAITLRDSLARDDPRFVEADSTVGNLMKELKTAEAAEAALGADRAWGEIPGIEGYKFAPEILESVRNLAVERNGEFGGLLDRVTSNIRTAMFTADLSAWTMQGWMLAMRDPRGAVKAMPHVLAASILGDRYTAEWIKDNYMLSRKWAARGVVNGRMVDEAAFGTKVGGMPIIHGIESRGFSNALPVFRILMAEHMSRMEALSSTVTEGGKFRTLAGNLGGNDFVRLSQVGANYGPMAAGIGVAAATDGGPDPKDWQDWFALALGAGGTVAMSKVLGKVEKSALDRLPAAQRNAVETRVAKDINRTSGIMNKPQMGISQKQAQIERTFLFRSPALLRNTLILAKLALTNSGPEGAMARVYLFQTAAIMAGAAALTEYALTGKMDSFDPNDPNSILNPAHFAQAGLGAGGKASASNPLVSLARAVFYHNYAEGEPDRGLQVPQPRDVAQGLLQFGENRMTDVVGQAFKPGVDLIREGISGRPVENESPFASGLKSASEGDLRGVGAAVGRMGVPIPIQEAAASGAFKDIGIEGNPDYNTAKERIFSPLATMAGFNASPETLSQETKRRTDAAIREQFPAASDFNKNGVIDRRDLNDADRLAFDASPAGQEIAAFREEVRALRPDEEVTQVDRYFTAIDRELDLHVTKLRDLENAVANKSISKFEYRAAYQAEQARYIQAKDTVERDFSEQVMERPVYNPDTGKVENEMSVVAYVNRGVHPEDQNVDEWFKLYDSATGPNGKIDFDKLETMQETYKRSLAPDEAAYLEQRLASFKDKGVTDSEGNTVPLPTLREYESVKEAAKPFWEIADQEFASLKERDPFFAQFANYNAYKKAILEAAQGDAIIAAAIEDGLKKRHPWLKRFSKSVERAQRTMRAQNVDLDIALTDWYERAPVNPLAYIARQAGDTQFDAMGQTFISGKRKVSQRQKLSLAQKYGLTSPDFGETFGYR